MASSRRLLPTKGELTKEQEEIAKLVDATILDRLTAIDDLLGKNALFLSEVLYELKKKKPPVIVAKEDKEIKIAPLSATLIPPFEITYPPDGTRKTLQTGTTTIDFLTGKVTHPDGSTENLSTSLKVEGYETIGAIFFEVDKAIKYHFDERGLGYLYAEDIAFHNHVNFRKLYITTTESTRFWVWASTDPDATFLKTRVGVLTTIEGLLLQQGYIQARRFITSDKDAHFTGTIATNQKEDEDLPLVLTNVATINSVSIQADQALNFRLIFWSKDTKDDTDLNTDSYIGHVDLNLEQYGFQIAGANQYYMEVDGIDMPYHDEDETNEFHVSLMNLSTTSKTGEVKIKIGYIPRV